MRGGDRLGSVEGRFTKPVLPGDELVVSAWREGDEILFRTTTTNGDGDGDIVLDRGRLSLRY